MQDAHVAHNLTLAGVLLRAAQHALRAAGPRAVHWGASAATGRSLSAVRLVATHIVPVDPETLFSGRCLDSLYYRVLHETQAA